MSGHYALDVLGNDMGDAEAALGIFSMNRDPQTGVERIGMGVQILPRNAIVAHGQSYFEIAAEQERVPDGSDPAARAGALANKLP